MDLLVSWYTEYQGHVFIIDKVLEMKISSMLHYTIIKKAFKSANLTQDDKEIINKIAFEGQITDSIIRV